MARDAAHRDPDRFQPACRGVAGNGTHERAEQNQDEHVRKRAAPVPFWCTALVGERNGEAHRPG